MTSTVSFNLILIELVPLSLAAVQGSHNSYENGIIDFSLSHVILQNSVIRTVQISLILTGVSYS